MIRPLAPRLLRLLGPCAALSVAAAVLLLTFFLAAHGLEAWGLSLFFGDAPPLRALFGLSPVWNGIWPACAGTLCLVVLTLLLALAPGIGCKKTPPAPRHLPSREILTPTAIAVGSCSL